MKRPKTIDDILDGWIGDLERDGTITRWEADKKLKAQGRKLRRLEREERAIRETLVQMGLENSA
jgi:hypothetical protein